MIVKVIRYKHPGSKQKVYVPALAMGHEIVYQLHPLAARTMGRARQAGEARLARLVRLGGQVSVEQINAALRAQLGVVVTTEPPAEAAQGEPHA